LLSGLTGLVFSNFLNIKLDIIIYFFFISFIFDFTDGLVARYQNTTSFHGRFIDGLFDILVVGFLHIVLIQYLFNSENMVFDKNFYYLTLLILPIQHLILDRFSALARWQNELDKSKKVKPYYRDSYLKYLIPLMLDLQHFSIFLLLFPNLFNVNFFIEIYFILSFLASILTIVLYIFLSHKYFSHSSNQLDNKDNKSR
jgi:phosphatidylglycerophosphate synthase